MSYPVNLLCTPNDEGVKCNNCGWPCMQCPSDLTNYKYPGSSVVITGPCRYHDHTPVGGWIHIGTGTHFCAANAIIEFRRKEQSG